eukprot:Protomagalhaensia_wolfi_Nauph_80__323@NODE_117_length_3585_cov_326_351100_g90_i0_p3_GENE_NODE_117_length_3585_cov_326_351100_g90_i0NODE_117_length_3585_cov_326_351100_g90_i0_p3_ORF_typecomplete_len202_score55_17Ribosomal_S7e/PF01251_18/6_9e52_NODE_117_length_3585_cov_326_351100_g90_i017342339
MEKQATPAARAFIHKLNRKPSETEIEIAQLCSEIAESSTNAEAKAAVATMRILRVKEVEVEETGKKALVVYVPYTIYTHSIRPQQQRIINELEKKTKKHVCLTTQRDIMKPGTVRPGMRVRPRSRYLTSVQEALLADLVAPTEVVGKRTRVTADGKKHYKIFLDPKDRTKESLEEKLTTFASVYKALTRKDAVFEFPEYAL